MTAIDTTQRLRKQPWHEEADYDAHGSLFALITHLRHQQRELRDDWWLHYRLFDRKGLQGTRHAGNRRRKGNGPRLALNVVRSATLAVHSKITQNKPRPTYLTLGGTYSARQKAKATQSYSDGCIYHANGYDVAADMALHAIVLGTATAYCYMGADGRPKVDNVLGAELDVERHDSASRNPKNRYRTNAMSRSELLEQYENDAEATEIIRDAPNAPIEFCIEEDDIADRVAVCQAFRRGTEDAPGRHVISLENGTLLDEPWPRGHPYVDLRWGTRLRGFSGYGVAEQLADLQYEINMLLMRIQEQMALAGPKVAIQRGSQIMQDDINNEIWGIIEYTGTPPTYMQYQSVDPALLQQVATLYGRAFDEVGVSQMAVRSEKPAGLNSGKALLTYSDLESAKFVAFGQAYERLLRDMSMQFIDIALAVEDGSEMATITFPTRKYRSRYLERINRKDIVASKDDYICQVFPTSALAQSPVAKMQQVGELMDKGLIDGPTGIKLLDFPDLDDETSLRSSPIEYIDMCIDRVLENGDSIRPEPWLDVDAAIPRVGMALMRAQIDGVPEDRWELLGYLLDACRTEQERRRAAAQAAVAPASGPPAGPSPDANAAPPSALQGQ